MKSPMVSKWRNKAPTDTPARLVITAADARAYPTSMMVAMLASRSRPTVSSRRCRWVLAMSDSDFHGAHAVGPLLARLPCTRPQVPARLHALPVTLTELASAEDDLAAHARRDDGRIIAIDHAAQAAVEGDLVLAIPVDGFVQVGRVDHHEVRAVALPQGAGIDAEPLRHLAGQAIHRAFPGQQRLPGQVRVPRALEQP